MHEAWDQGGRQAGPDVGEWELERTCTEAWVQPAVVLELGKHQLHGVDGGGVEPCAVDNRLGTEDGDKGGEGEADGLPDVGLGVE